MVVEESAHSATWTLTQSMLLEAAEAAAAFDLWVSSHDRETRITSSNDAISDLWRVIADDASQIAEHLQWESTDSSLSVLQHTVMLARSAIEAEMLFWLSYDPMRRLPQTQLGTGFCLFRRWLKNEIAALKSLFATWTRWKDQLAELENLPVSPSRAPFDEAKRTLKTKQKDLRKAEFDLVELKDEDDPVPEQMSAAQALVYHARKAVQISQREVESNHSALVKLCVHFPELPKLFEDIDIGLADVSSDHSVSRSRRLDMYSEVT